MGIPFYFGEIIAKCPVNKRFHIVADKLSGQCSRFFMDFNSIIHPCSAQVVAKLNREPEVGDALYNSIFDNIARYTINLIDIAQPSDIVYIAIDGVAPRGKMHQQRKRRYLSAQRNKQITQFKARHGIQNTKWDSNCITPGTEFMEKLDVYLSTTFRDIVATKFPSLKQLVVSGSNEPGEGEHKMIHYIKKNHTLACDVIYGLDADLIMLSLTTHTSNIILMRESQDFGPLASSQRVPFKYLVINHLRDSIVERLSTIKPEDMHNPVNMINDYVFMCFLLGNDFIPALSFLKIKDGAVDVLIDTYKETCAESSLIQQNASTSSSQQEVSYCINFEALTNFVGCLKRKEDALMSKVVEHYNNALPKPQRNFNTIIQNIKYHNPRLSLNEVNEKAVREFSFDLDEYALRNKFVVDIDPTNDKKWRNSYYHYVFDSNALETINDACKEYFQGLLWTANYYFDQSACQQWYYHYHFAPCASDVHKYMLSIDNNRCEHEKAKLKQAETMETDFNPAHLQLLLVLPPDSLELLPLHLRPIMTNFSLGCVRFYPKDFRVQTYLKHKTWECTPLIPQIDVEAIKQQLRNL